MITWLFSQLFTAGCHTVLICDQMGTCQYIWICD